VIRRPAPRHHHTTGRPAVREVFAYWPALLAKDAATPAVQVVG
jgi:hypothetical protein